MLINDLQTFVGAPEWQFTKNSFGQVRVVLSFEEVLCIFKINHWFSTKDFFSNNTNIYIWINDILFYVHNINVKQALLVHIEYVNDHWNNVLHPVDSFFFKMSSGQALENFSLINGIFGDDFMWRFILNVPKSPNFLPNPGKWMSPAESIVNVVYTY